MRRGSAGFLVCLVLVGVGTRLARRYASVLERWDQAVRGRLDAEAWLTVDGALWLGVPGDTLVLVGVVVGAAVIAIDRGRPFRALTLLAALPLVEGLVLVGWLSWSRPRPGSLLGGIGGWEFPAFPSGHAAQSAVVYGLLALWWAQGSARRSERATAGLAAVGVWALIAYCRVRVGSHWPSDVLAGGLLGGLWLAVLAAALRAVEPRRV